MLRTRLAGKNSLLFGGRIEFNQQGKESFARLCCFSSKTCVQIKLRTQSSSSVELLQPMSTDSCGPFTNYWSPQVSLHLHLNLVQHASVLTCS